MAARHLARSLAVANRRDADRARLDAVAHRNGERVALGVPAPVVFDRNALLDGPRDRRRSRRMAALFARVMVSDQRDALALLLAGDAAAIRRAIADLDGLGLAEEDHIAALSEFYRLALDVLADKDVATVELRRLVALLAAQVACGGLDLTTPPDTGPPLLDRMTAAFVAGDSAPPFVADLRPSSEAVPA